MVINTLINDSKLPLNNLTLKTERGLARRVPVWFLRCLEYKECIRTSKQWSFLFRVLYLFSSKKKNWSWGRLLFETLRLKILGRWMRVFSDTAETCGWTFSLEVCLFFLNMIPQASEMSAPLGASHVSASTSWVCVDVCVCDLMQFGFLWTVGLRLKESGIYYSARKAWRCFKYMIIQTQKVTSLNMNKLCHEEYHRPRKGVIKCFTWLQILVLISNPERGCN